MVQRRFPDRQFPYSNGRVLSIEGEGGCTTLTFEGHLEKATGWVS